MDSLDISVKVDEENVPVVDSGNSVVSEVVPEETVESLVACSKVDGSSEVDSLDISGKVVVEGKVEE